MSRAPAAPRGRRGVLPRSFYKQPTLDVCRDVLGCLLVHESDEGLCSGRIIEVEAYLAPEDEASHAYNNRLTKRNAPMHGPKGRAYVYLIYGMHWCFNIVTGPPGSPQAVLVRALEPVDGVALQARRRGVDLNRPRAARNIASGPAKLCQALAITGEHNEWDLNDSNLYLVRDVSYKDDEIVCAPRIGIGYAGPWVDKPLRYLVGDHPFVSRKVPANARSR